MSVKISFDKSKILLFGISFDGGSSINFKLLGVSVVWFYTRSYYDLYSGRASLETVSAKSQSEYVVEKTADFFTSDELKKAFESYIRKNKLFDKKEIKNVSENFFQTMSYSTALDKGFVSFRTRFTIDFSSLDKETARKLERIHLEEYMEERKKIRQEFAKLSWKEKVFNWRFYGIL